MIRHVSQSMESTMESAMVYCSKLVDACGGIDKIASWPVLDLKGRVGFTGYIDFIQPGEMSESIMRGVDCHGRYFLTFRYRYLNKDTKQEPENIGVIVETIFQRYSDNCSVLASGGNGHELLGGCRVHSNEAENEYMERIRRLINHETVTAWAGSDFIIELV